MNDKQWWEIGVALLVEALLAAHAGAAAAASVVASVTAAVVVAAAVSDVAAAVVVAVAVVVFVSAVVPVPFVLCRVDVASLHISAFAVVVAAALSSLLGQSPSESNREVPKLRGAQEFQS